MTPQDVGVMDRARPAYDAKGIPLGGFRLFPSLDVVGTYDDNVFRLPTGQSDYFFYGSADAEAAIAMGPAFLRNLWRSR